jgi:Transcriptional Coactivator p15 (PC4)
LTQIAEIEKNVKERIRVSIEEYHGRTFVDCRVYFRDDQGEWRPTKKGIALNLDCINEVIEDLQRAGRKLEDALTFNADTTKGKGTRKHADPVTEPVLPLSEPVLNMVRTVGAGCSMRRNDLQEALRVCDKSLRRYIGQALKGGFIEVEGRGPGQRIRVMELPDRLDKTDCPEMSKSPNADNWTGEGITNQERSVL